MGGRMKLKAQSLKLKKISNAKAPNGELGTSLELESWGLS